MERNREICGSSITKSPAADGSGGSGTFTFTASSGYGFQDIAQVQILFNSSVAGANGCYLQYQPSSNVIQLSDNTGTQWPASGTLGSAGTISNGQCSVNLAASTWSGPEPTYR